MYFPELPTDSSVYQWLPDTSNRTGVALDEAETWKFPRAPPQQHVQLDEELEGGRDWH